MFVTKNIIFKGSDKRTIAESEKTFHEVANKYSFDIDLKFGNTEVDGKSMLGITIIPGNKIVEMTVLSHNYSDEEITRIFKRWIVA